MKRLVIAIASMIVLAIAATFILPAPQLQLQQLDPGDIDDGNGGRFRIATVPVNGHDITCITWKSGSGGGLSCDWLQYEKGE
jgi:hypothetical protein